VIDVAVGFDYEPTVHPQEVDEIGTDADVDLWRRDPVTTTER
jgi:hypothetical protein